MRTLYLPLLAALTVLLCIGIRWRRGMRPAGGRQSGALGPASARDLAGIWRQATAEPLVGYLYFTRSGAVYYMASKIPATEAMFTGKFKIAEEYSDHAFSRWSFIARRREGGGLLLSVSGEAIGGTYYKIG